MSKYTDAVRNQVLTVGEGRYTYEIREGRGGYLVLD